MRELYGERTKGRIKNTVARIYSFLLHLTYILRAANLGPALGGNLNSDLTRVG
jgi:hypothetical protein